MSLLLPHQKRQVAPTGLRDRLAYGLQHLLQTAASLSRVLFFRLALSNSRKGNPRKTGLARGDPMLSIWVCLSSLMFLWFQSSKAEVKTTSLGGPLNKDTANIGYLKAWMGTTSY